MSHFSVLVIGSNVEEQLTPYHEFECTGHNDQYVQDIDITEETIQEFNEATRTVLVSPDGEFFSKYDNQFYREPTEEEKETLEDTAGSFGSSSSGLPYSTKDWGNGELETKIRYVPDGWEKVEKPLSELESFAEWLEGWHGYQVIDNKSQPDTEGDHKYGYAVINENGKPTKIIQRTNPNAKWDWYSIGGRWSGMLKLKPGATGEHGEPGLGALLSGNTQQNPEYVDAAYKRDIDIQAMWDEAANKAAEIYDKVHKAAGQNWESFEIMCKKFATVEEAREAYHKQPALKAIKEADLHMFFGFDEFLAPREQYIQEARDSVLSTYAIVMDGEWYAKGEMGWFGMSDDNITQEEWNKKVHDLLAELPDDTLLTIVDCHT